ncbi:MAG TPA: efflux RND transporter periplasmic adaptor subunit [Mariprofundaceae bacterium]|nr:efflux RND transporter periplasmic adaptor subunit [Mariprofundaceae bacterium]
MNGNGLNGNRSMKKRMLIMLLLVGVVFGGLLGFQMFKAKMMAQYFASQGLPPATVTTLVAGFSDWQPQVAAVGTLRARQGVQLVSELAGVVKQVHFQSGAAVKRGDLLISLDADVERAQLAAAKAAAELAVTTLKRDREQLKVLAVSQAQIDAAEADVKAKQAQVDQIRAVIAKLEIRAPFSGTVGVTTVSTGQYLKAGDAIVSLQSIDPILVDFHVPQRYLPILKTGQTVHLSGNGFEGHDFQGQISAIDNVVNRNTRNVHVEARVANPDGALLPGMYAEVRIDAGVAERYLTLPQTAVSYNAYGSTLFLAKQVDGKDKPLAEQVFVTTGSRRGDQIAVTSGIKEGDVVVTSGQMKLKNGTPLIVNNTVEPAFEVAPTPQEH